MSNPHEHLPPVDKVTPTELAQEAVLHHAGANALSAHVGGSAGLPDTYYYTRDLYQCEKPTPAPWLADAHETWASPRLDVTDQHGRAIACVFSDADGVQWQVCGTRGKAEIEWANAALIARMRQREPVIAAACLRLEAENRRLRAEIEELRGALGAAYGGGKGGLM
jgi:hypothetical protein